MQALKQTLKPYTMQALSQDITMTTMSRDNLPTAPLSPHTKHTPYPPIPQVCPTPSLSLPSPQQTLLVAAGFVLVSLAPAIRRNLSDTAKAPDAADCSSRCT